jgi:hypothetical protein
VERIPDGVPEDFRALDGNEIVGRVRQIPTRPERGLWFWTMTALRPVPRIACPTNGMEARHGDAGRRVVEAYERLIQHNGEGRQVEAREKPRGETPLAWFYLAHAYLHDAAILNAASKPPGGHYDAPVRFLYVHAIELFLKAYLRLRGVDEAALGTRKYGHRLNALANEAETRGLLITRRLRPICDANADFGDPKTARYIERGIRYEIPRDLQTRANRRYSIPLNKLHEAARDLQTGVGTALRDAGIKVRRLPELPIVHPRRLSARKALNRLAREEPA